MIKRFATAAAAATMLLAAGSSSVSASKPKPLGYTYGQCTSQTDCTNQASTNPQQNKIALSSTLLCQTGANALNRVGLVPVKHGGKFSVNKTITITPEYGAAASVQVQFSGTLKVGKKVTGKLKITTTSSDCTADTGVQKSFSMKYKGPFYGG